MTNWFSTQKRMLPFYLEEIKEGALQALRLLVNLLIFVTLPLWVGFAFMVMLAIRAKDGDVETMIFKGQVWFWELFS